ncbi:hypothetical protein [Rhabdaerophilum calidifontis]|uniref:hypothetical protein n=1 Tax=Rhabdaerophilum calidifontis TaxID=2604328 RepID=UPI00140AF1A7|nr:hypothetical protein [Rhabdaerophilum calidifontis]
MHNDDTGHRQAHLVYEPMIFLIVPDIVDDMIIALAEEIRRKFGDIELPPREGIGAAIDLTEEIDLILGAGGQRLARIQNALRKGTNIGRRPEGT